MDKKFEDQVAKMAFGELSEAEASEVRAHAAANADAGQMLASYEALRSDLRRLKDVPPDQLSKERLQNAILTQGLKPKPVRRSNPWAWSASGVFVVALVALFLAKSQQPLQPQQKQPVVMDFHRSATPSIVDENASADQSLDSSLNGDDRSQIEEAIVFTPTPQPQPKFVAPDNAPQVLPKKAVAVTIPIDRNTKTRSISNLPTRGEVRKELPDNSSSSKDNLALEPVTAPAADKKAPETLVLIQSDMDGNTGANNAVEVHQTEDVIVSS